MRQFIIISLLIGIVFPKSEIGKDIPQEFFQICEELHLQKNCLEGVKIFFAKDIDEMTYLAGGGVPEWGAGIAIPEKDVVIILRVGSIDEQRKVLLHELTHIALHRKLRSRKDNKNIHIPRWFDEGVAQLHYGFNIHRQSQLAWAVLWRNIFPLEALERVNGFVSPHAKVAYAEAHDAALYIENYCTIGALCDSIASAGDFNEGFLKATGISIYEFYDEWKKHLVRSYILFVLLGDSRFLWVLIVLLFLLLGIMKIIRQRLQMAKLHRQAEIEGWQDPEHFFQGYDDHGI